VVRVGEMMGQGENKMRKQRRDKSIEEWSWYDRNAELLLRFYDWCLWKIGVRI
jgi:hypothetical protein